MPRAGLNARVVVAEAARLADEVGFDRLTLAGLASRLGVAVPSLYKHVDGLDAVRRGVSLVAIRELEERMEAALRGQGGVGDQDRLMALARAFRAYALEHPGRYAATVRAAPAEDVELTAASAAVLEIVAAVLVGRGLRGADAIDATRALRAALHGFVSLEAAGGFGIPQDVGRSFDRMVEALDRGL